MTPHTRRRFAQHFLEDSWVARIIDLIEPQPADTIIEIGPGRGALTTSLVRSGATVVAVEIDRDLARALQSEAAPNLTVVPQDFLTLDLESLPVDVTGARIVGNLPYSVGSPIVVRLLRASRGGQYLRDAVVMLQREVADRMTSRPGTRDWGPLGVATRLYAEASRALTLPPGAFRPMPKVTSAVVVMRFRPPEVSVPSPMFFDQMVRVMFTQRRKTALNALGPFAAKESSLPVEQVFEQAGVEPRKRPGDLELSELADLSEVLRLAPL